MTSVLIANKNSEGNIQELLKIVYSYLNKTLENSKYNLTEVNHLKTIESNGYMENANNTSDFKAVKSTFLNFTYGINCKFY